MDYCSFFQKLKNSDFRVTFTKVDKHLECEGLEIPEFYQIVNPVNVEFEFNDGIVRLEPFEGLLALNEEYRCVTADCVFATCNGDPIYIRDGKVYTCVHGTRRMMEERIAASVDDLFEQVCNAL